MDILGKNCKERNNQRNSAIQGIANWVILKAANPLSRLPYTRLSSRLVDRAIAIRDSKTEGGEQ